MSQRRKQQGGFQEPKAAGKVKQVRKIRQVRKVRPLSTRPGALMFFTPEQRELFQQKAD